jgi:hypothetical protein
MTVNHRDHKLGTRQILFALPLWRSGKKEEEDTRVAGSILVSCIFLFFPIHNDCAKGRFDWREKILCISR